MPRTDEGTEQTKSEPIPGSVRAQAVGVQQPASAAASGPDHLPLAVLIRTLVESRAHAFSFVDVSNATAV
jgi:hypothetical protein